MKNSLIYEIWAVFGINKLITIICDKEALPSFHC